MSGVGSAPAPPPSRARPRRRRWPWLLLGLPLLLVMLLALLLYAVLATEVGGGWLLRQLSDAAPAQDMRFEFTASRGALIDRVELDGVVLHVGGAEIEVDELQLAWQPRALWERLLHVERLAIDGLRVVPPPATEPTVPEPPSIPDLALPVTVRVDRLVVDDVVVTQPAGDIVVDHLGLSASADGDGLRVADLELRVPGASVAGRLSMSLGAPHVLDGELAVAIDAALSGAQVGDVALDLTLAGEALQPAFDVRVTAPLPLRAAGTAALDRLTPAFDIDASWPALQWPLQGDPQLRTGAGSLQVEGNTQAYRIALRAPVDVAGYVPDAPPVDVALRASGDPGGLMLQPLTLGIGDGELRADGRVDWRDGVDWRLELVAERLDPGLLAADWPGRLGARVRVDGQLRDDGQPAVAAVIEQLAGTLRGYPVSGSGAVAWRAGRLRADGLDLASGSNRVRVDGEAGERLDLTFALDAPDLAGLYPGLGGSLSGDGRLAGTAKAPAVDASVRGKGLRYGDAQAADMALDLDWRGEGGSATLEAGGLVSGATTLHRLSAGVEGRVDAHRLRIDADGGELQVALAAEGGVDTARARWRGTLRRLDVSAGALGAWGLRGPAGLQLGPDIADIERVCLQQAPTALCLRGGWAGAGGLDIDGELLDLDLARLGEYLPGEAVVEGELGATFAVGGTVQSPTAGFALRPGDGRIRVDDGVEPFELAYSDARVDGRFADDRATVDLRFDVGRNGQARGQVVVGAERDGRRVLDGSVNVDFPDLALVAGFVPALEAVQGRLAVALDLGGTLAEPTLRGDAVISGAAARVPAAGIQLADVRLRVSGDGLGPLRVDGALASGDGTLTVDGTADPAGGAAVDLHIRGNDFQAVRLPEANVLVSPDLRLQGKGPYRLTGTLRIPQADIEIKELPPNTVKVSDDQVIVGTEAPAPQAATDGTLQANVRVELGDDVTFKGFGLETGLTGAVDASSGPRGTLVDGKIELRDATYKAYGQDLTVERGRLLFAGPPGNPDVDLRAVRVSNDGQVKAYVEMSGPLAKPRPRVYTEPALPEAEAVSYLLTGRGLGAGGGDDVSVASAALSLGLARGESLLDDVGGRLGLDDLRIEDSGGGLADSSLLLGKYLNPDLYLGYSQGLFNPEGAVLLRLRLSERLELESRSGNEQSVDLFYKLEHD